MNLRPPIPKGTPRREGVAEVHDLKINPFPFGLVRAGKKLFEIRKDDREFRSGDTLRLWEYWPQSERFSGRVVEVTVTCALRDGWGLKDGYVALGTTEPYIPPGGYVQ